jgi:hypothetical protein
MPYPQRRSTEAIGFRSQKRRRRSAHLLFLGGGAGQGQLARGGCGCKGVGRSCAAGQGAMGRPVGARAGRRIEGQAEQGDGDAGERGAAVLAAAARERGLKCSALRVGGSHSAGGGHRGHGDGGALLRLRGREVTQGAMGNRGSWWRPRAGNAEGGCAGLPFYRVRRLGWWTGQHAGQVGLGRRPKRVLGRNAELGRGVRRPRLKRETSYSKLYRMFESMK